MPVAARADEQVSIRVGEGLTSIPVRNLWLLFLYASDLYEHLPAEQRVSVENNPEELPELAARILCEAAEHTLRRNLSVGYIERHETLTSVRHRIDHLSTARGAQLQRGQVTCYFEDLTNDTPRNRYFTAALHLAGRRLRTSTIDPAIAARCLSLTSQLERAGVTLDRPNPNTPRQEVYGHYDRRDRRSMAAAQLVVEALMPSHAAGQAQIHPLRHTHGSLRKLFEVSIRNFYRVNLPEYRVGARDLRWPSDGELDPLFPAMRTDITVDRPDGTRLIIDTKFTSALSMGAIHHQPRLRSGHLYQLYAYLNTQSQRGDVVADHAEGLLLYPSTDLARDINISADMQGHKLSVATVDLEMPPAEIRARLLELAGTNH